MHNDTFALHVGKEALQQGSSTSKETTARKLGASSSLIVIIDRGAENVCESFTCGGLEPMVFAGDESPSCDRESTSVVIRSRHGRPELRWRSNGPPPMIPVRCSEPSCSR